MAFRSAFNCEFKSDVYSTPAPDGTMLYVECENTFNDIPPQLWQYDVNSSASDDYAGGVIKPTSVSGNGRWLRRGVFNHQANWNEASATSPAYINNKPALAAVATSGSYNDLSNTPSIPSTSRTTSGQTLSLVGTGATGTQIDATKDCTVRVSCSVSCTSTIGGASTSLIELKINSTNSATEGTWTTVAFLGTDQTITLALALQSVQVVRGQLTADVPAGWYVKLVNSGTGTHAEQFLSGQKTIYG